MAGYVIESKVNRCAGEYINHGKIYNDRQKP